MAARLRLRHQEEVRAKIQASQIINRLQKAFAGEIELTPVQVSVGKLLLDKALPNLQAVELTGDAENPVEHKHTVALSPEDAYKKMLGI